MLNVVRRWTLDIGLRTSENVGPDRLDVGRSAVGCWTLKVERCTLGVGRWTFGTLGRWTLDVSRWTFFMLDVLVRRTLNTFDVGRWTLDVGR